MKPTSGYIKQIGKILQEPITNNLCFFIMMYLLGTFCILIIDECVFLPFYIKLFFELFFDLYLLCSLLTFLPKPICSVAKLGLSIFFYSCAIIDIFCTTRLDTRISPSIMQLILETNNNEAGNFFSTYINWGVIISPIGVVLLIVPIHLCLLFKTAKKHTWSTITALPIVFLLIVGVWSSIKNKHYLYTLFSKSSVDDIEQYMAHENWAARSLYTPIHRFIFAIHTNVLASHQLDNLVKLYDDIEVTCDNNAQNNIILIIGESYNKHHSQLYGYQHKTTPYEKQRQENGELFVFQDAVSPFNLTSDVIKNMFSTNDLSNRESWTSHPLFTQLFHKAGYNVSFITNQYVKNADKEFFDFSGGVFLKHDKIEKTQFNHRKQRMHDDDIILLTEYDSLKQYNTNKNLIIFHLLGQHFNYRNRFPKDSVWFKTSNYNRKDLNEYEKQIIADYDNATRYNDYVVNEIIKKFEEQDAIILYLADHGEECFDGLKQSGRIHSLELTKTIVKNEFQIPLWIWCSKTYQANHQNIVSRIKDATDKPFFSDDIPHILLDLGGIQSKNYNARLNILSPQYDKMRKRMLRGDVNYQEFTH